MERLELRLLGFPEFRLNGWRVELALRKAAALLITLAEAGDPVARDVAATLLWPEADEEAARACLRRTLYKIRNRLRQRGYCRQHQRVCALRLIAQPERAHCLDDRCEWICEGRASGGFHHASQTAEH